jgi:hypothetical protein
MNFESIDFDIKDYIKKNDLESLNIIKWYLDYALVTTIKRQLPDISLKDEKLYAKKLLSNYFKGDMHSFTSKNNIRNNIYSISNDRIIDLFLKCMIEKHAYNVLIMNMQGSSKYNDQCCNYITNRLAHNRYNDVIEWLNEDFDNIEELISNYVDIFYKRNNDECMDLEKLTEKGNDTSKAIENLCNKIGV